MITKENWQKTTINAIETLPADILPSVGYVKSQESISIRVACMPFSAAEGESHIAKVDVRFLREPLGDNPTITVLCESDVVEVELQLNSATIDMFTERVQYAILNELYRGGGFSMVFLDEDQKFVRPDGTFLLDWQRPEDAPVQLGAEPEAFTSAMWSKMKVAYFRVPRERGTTDLDAAYDLAKYLLYCCVKVDEFWIKSADGTLILLSQEPRVERAVKALINWRETINGNQTLYSCAFRTVPGYPHTKLIDLGALRFAITPQSMPVQYTPEHTLE